MPPAGIRCDHRQRGSGTDAVHPSAQAAQPKGRGDHDVQQPAGQRVPPIDLGPGTRDDQHLRLPFTDDLFFGNGAVVGHIADIDGTGCLGNGMERGANTIGSQVIRIKFQFGF